MTLSEFKSSIAEGAQPPGVSVLVEALWWAAKGDRDRAHGIAQDVDTRDGAWVHAYLHRVEGDAGNAAYWYRQAGQPVAQGSSDEEWEAIAAALLAR